MRLKIMLILGLISASLVGVSSPANAGFGDAASGFGSVSSWPHCPLGSDALISFSATGSLGTAATGSFQVGCSGSTQGYSGDVTCLTVEGREAILGIVVTSSTAAAFPLGTEMSLTVEDGDPIGASDRVSALMSGSNCVHSSPNYLLANGDIVVTDGGDALPECMDQIDNDGDGLVDFPFDPGCESQTDPTESPNPVPPAPTSKEDCDKGGYQAYGFKNHGSCVAFVSSKNRKK